MAKQNSNPDMAALIGVLSRIERKLDKLDKQSNLDKQYLSTAEACRFMACSRAMIYNLVQTGKLTKLKMENGRTYYAAAELKKLIDSSSTEIAA